MGMFAGSIHIQGSDSGEVIPVLEKIHKVHGAKFMVEDAPGGWCSVFPHNSGQDSELAREIMKSFPHKAINLVVHDSDILFIDIFDGQSGFRTYNNNPTYFGEKLSPEEVQALKTYPENFSFFAPTEKIPQLKALFSPLGEVVFVDGTLTSIAKILGIPQAAFSYEYIETGEYVSQARRKKLLTVPPKESEQVGEAETKERVKALKKEKLLVFEKKGGPHRGGIPFRWKRDPNTGHVGITYNQDGIKEGKLIWSSGEFQLKPDEKGLQRRPLNEGYSLFWDKAGQMLQDERGRTILQFPKERRFLGPVITPDKSLFFWDEDSQVKWVDLKTQKEGAIDLSVLPETQVSLQNQIPEKLKPLFIRRHNPSSTLGPPPYLAIAQGPYYLLYDWASRQIMGYGMPQFPAYTEELLAQGLWRKESPEIWEHTENFILGHKNITPRYQYLRQFFDPLKNYIFLSDGHFTGKFTLGDFFAGRGNPSCPNGPFFLPLVPRPVSRCSAITVAACSL